MKSYTMKTRNLIHFILLLSLVFISCEATDDNSNTEMFNTEAIRATAISGMWTISLFEEDGKNETSDFSGFEFAFNEDGSIQAINGDATISGAWSIQSDDDDDDDIDFNIFFTSPANFTELSDDWDMVSYSTSRIELKDISGGDGSIDRLIFEKQ